MAATAEPLVYLVLRNHWEDGGDGTMRCPHGRDEGVPERAFRARDQAAAARDELEQLTRAKADPFTYAASAVDENYANGDFVTVASEAGLAPAPVSDPEFYQPTEWAAWWWQAVA